MTPNQFRRIALSMQGAIESAHMNHPDFRANGRIFATLSEDGRKGMVALTPEQQQEFMREHPGIFEPASGAWGRQGSTMVVLAAVEDEETVGEAMTLAWQNSARAKSKVSAPKKTRAKAAKRPASATARTAPRRRRTAK